MSSNYCFGFEAEAGGRACRADMLEASFLGLSIALALYSPKYFVVVHRGGHSKARSWIGS